MIRSAEMRETNISHRRQWHALFIVLLAVWSFIYASVPVLAADDFAEELKIGKEEADRYAADKNTKFITDAALVAKIETIGKSLAEVAKEKEVKAIYGKPTLAKFDYAFKIVEDKDINAFSLPGGFIYVNKGLLDFAQSDDELAGVIAHEIAHVAHHHAMQLITAQQKQMAALAGVVIAGAVLGAKGEDLGSLAYMGNLISLAKMSSYGQVAEFDADRTAVAFMSGTKYNPVGMLTFMERLARDEMRRPEVNYGIFATHPPSTLRAKEIIDEIQKRGLTINRRLVTTYMRVDVKPVEGSSASAVWVTKTEIIRLADSGGRTSSARAEIVAEGLRNALMAGAKFRDVRLSNDGDTVIIMGNPVISPTAEDAALAGTDIKQAASSAAFRMKQALMNELLDQG